ncbi:MAG: hypothetical protein KDA89_24835, partial [Planctomycetaceae bacterium]|nr:hypothetical protein [Planctomycetaceae bacterium]
MNKTFLFAVLALCGVVYGDEAGSPASSDVAVSYHKQIRPIFQARCQGCHQPARARANGHYDMTDFAAMI